MGSPLDARRSRPSTRGWLKAQVSIYPAWMLQPTPWQPLGAKPRTVPRVDRPDQAANRGRASVGYQDRFAHRRCALRESPAFLGHEYGAGRDSAILHSIFAIFALLFLLL